MGTEVIDHGRLKKLRLRCDTDDPLHRGMKKLKIRGKDLGRLPKEIYHITELEVLDLSPEREACINYRLPDVHPGIGKLINLRILMLDTNELDELPQEIGLLTSLEKLSLSNNHLTYLPEGFASLRNLKSLHLANNDFEKFPLQTCELGELAFLDMCDNRLVEVPGAVEKLESLESLLLFINQIVALPDEICKLTNLRCLWLGLNKLQRLPRDFGELRMLDWGGLMHTSSCVIDGNPITYPPLDVCKRGVEHIAHYFNTADPHHRS